MAIKVSEDCIKMQLPNGKVVDILSGIFTELKKWIQVGPEDSESGGFIVGYKHSETGNITLENISHPYPLDRKNRIHFAIRDTRHKIFLLKYKLRNSYYMGVWHTHPQSVPIPSSIDWKDWNETLDIDRTACEYIFFIIAGIDEIRVWIGSSKDKKIVEIFECEKEGDLYKKG